MLVKGRHYLVDLVYTMYPIPAAYLKQAHPPLPYMNLYIYTCRYMHCCNPNYNQSNVHVCANV